MANDFYNGLNQPVSDFTGSSKGYKADTSLATAIEGTGDVVKMATATADQYYKGTIKEQAKSATDELYNQYGNDAAVAVNTGIKGEATPQEIQKGADKLNLLKQAAEAGQLKDSSFWAQAELISRQLKNKYPGYWEEIDNTMSGILGRKPASALQSELQQERAANSSKEDREYNNALHAARSEGITEPFSRAAAGKPMSTNEINSLVANRNAVKWQQTVDNSNYQKLKNGNNLTEDKVLNAAGKEAQAELLATLSSTTSPLFKDYQDYQNYANEVESFRRSGQPIPPEVQAKITAASSQIEATVKAITNKYLTKYGGDVSGNKLNDRLSFLSDFVKNYTGLVKEGDRNVGAYNTALIKSIDDADMFNYVIKNDSLRRFHIMSNAFGSQGLATALGMGQGQDFVNQFYSATEALVSGNVRGKMVMEGISITEANKETQNQGITNPKVFRDNVQTILNGIASPDIPTEYKVNLFKSLWGDKNANWLKEGVNEEERVPMFLKVTSPYTLKTVKEMYDQGKITPDEFNLPVTWSVTNGIDLLHDYSANIRDIAENRKGIGAWYNPETNKISTQDIPTYTVSPTTAVGKIAARLPENLLSSADKRAVEQANFILNRLSKVMETTGEDPKVEIPKILAKAGINLPTSREEGLDKSKVGPTGAESVVEAAEKLTAKDTVDTLVEAVTKSLGDKFSKQISDNIDAAFKNLSK